MARPENRRVSERIKFRFPLLWGEGTPHLTAYSYDLSEGGMCIYCSNNINKGTEITLEIMVDGKHISFSGEVVWSNQSLESDAYRAGIQISDYPNSLKKVYDKMR